MYRSEESAAIVHRSGSAARRANVAPATLRVWERRYAVVDPQRSPAGQRLYSETDIKRLKLLKRLVDRGCAIGTVARLSLEQLEFLNRAADPSQQSASAFATTRWMIVGKSLAERLAQLAPAIRTQEVFDNLGAVGNTPVKTDVLLIHSPSLREEAAETILSLIQRTSPASVAVLYSFGIVSCVGALKRMGVRLYREPLSRAQLLQIVEELSQTAVSTPGSSPVPSVRPTRLFSDRDLGFIERQVTSVTCECPTHLTTLVSQLAAFEAYTDDCRAQHAADADLHRQMGDAASHARALFENLLQRLAVQEGWPLEAPPA